MGRVKKSGRSLRPQTAILNPQHRGFLRICPLDPEDWAAKTDVAFFFQHEVRVVHAGKSFGQRHFNNTQVRERERPSK